MTETTAPMTAGQCPATTSTLESLHSVRSVGVQCKFTRGHDGDHWGYVGPFAGEMRWPQEALVGEAASTEAAK